MTSRQAVEKAEACMSFAEQTEDLDVKVAMSKMAKAYCVIAEIRKWNG